MLRILVTDLDGTLLGGDEAERRRLHAALARHPEVTVVLATGRGLSSVREILRDPLVPKPRWIIADVGASVIDGEEFAPVSAIQDQLRASWPGRRRVREAMARFPELSYQEGVAQDGRCSYHLAPDALSERITAAVHALGCGWLYSGDRYFDVLPAGVSKGSALRALAEKLDWPVESILVAGDSLNDLSLFQLGAHGVIVGGAEPALLAAVPESALVHRPEERGAAGILAALDDLGWIPESERAGRGHPLVVGYHRPPVSWTPQGWQPPASPNGILPTLNSLFSSGLPGVWVAAAVGDPGLDPAAAQHPGEPLSLLPLTAGEWAGYFHRACKETLWPVLMSEPDRLRFDATAWADYRTVNARFAEHIGRQAAPGATVWLHDYNLWLVPGLLRGARPDLRIGLFHHTPFPSPEIFAALPGPVATEIRTSLGSLDWAGFHTEAFADRFRHTLAGRSGSRPGLPRLGVHPLGIDRPAIEELARDRLAHRRAGHGPLVLSVERLDYAKAPVQKVETIARLLARHPELRGRLTFRLVCPPPEPGITAYDTTRRLLEQRVDDVNHTWSEGSWRPVDYLPRGLPFAEVIDQYLSADVLWVTSLQDGMNLTAKEFIAAQAVLARSTAGRSGVLVLSDRTGAATELATAALLTDPRSPEDLAATLTRALALTPAERRARLDRLSALLGHERPADWAARIVRAIRSPAGG
ncbi:HAD-IIB family hydrolase [Kitasatospora sp. NPDC052896]|uniref:HAD-IIB family hydrolase n=1 Tax=Kitasatospora sp. NPDC052896 TaxID=3364061 RepID=UPI0037C826E4